MDITTLAAWGEFIGDIAVVVSLIYLASQIRQNSKLLKASTASATHEVLSLSNSFVVQDPEMARIYWDGMEDHGIFIRSQFGNKNGGHSGPPRYAKFRWCVR